MSSYLIFDGMTLFLMLILIISLWGLMWLWINSFPLAKQKSEDETPPYIIYYNGIGVRSGTPPYIIYHNGIGG